MHTPPRFRRTTPPGLAAAAAILIALAQIAGPAQAQVTSSCSSDGQPQPRTLVERFLRADCVDCWTENVLPKPPRGAVTLDWVLPVESGDDAPMSAVARRDAQQRLDALPSPQFQGGQLMQSLNRSERIGRHRLRVQHGPTVGDHVGASLRFHAQRGAKGPFTGWLAVVEWLPAGTEGSPIPRQLVRNLLVEPITPEPSRDWPYQLWRPMNLPEGTRPERLGVVGWVTDADGGMVALAQARCIGQQ